MKVFAAPGPAQELQEIACDPPLPVGREVLLKVTHSGVCHSDTHSHAGAYDLGRRGQLSIVDRGLQYPAVFGHEIVGEVVAVGPEASGVTIGNTRLVFPWIGCGECARCRSGRTNLCRKSTALGVFRWGGFATQVLVPDSDFLVDIDGLDPSWAATLACSGLTSFSAINRILPLGADETIAVLGAGGVGLTAIALLSKLTEARIVAVDVSDERLALASELGAHTTVNSAALEAGANLTSVLGEPIQAAIDFVNNGATFSLAFDSMDKAGILVSIGLFGGESTIPNALLPLKTIEIVGSYVGNLEELKTLVELAKTETLPRVPLIEKELNLKNVSESLQGLLEGTVSGRTILTQR